MKSIWKDTVPNILEEQKQLKKESKTEVCIIGGGITGITTAYYLTNAGKKVVLLERDTLANKTTGNTTAKITSQHGIFYKYLLEDHGKDFAKKYYMANQEAIKNIEEIIKKENIDCDFERQDAYIYTRDAKELKNIKDEVKYVKAIGGEAEFVEKIELKLEGIQGAIKFPNQAQFNPRKYLKALAKKVIENRGEIYENTIVRSIKKEESGYRICSDKGCVIAKDVVIATNYPVINFPGFYFIKMYQSASYAIAVETEEELFSGMYINAEEPTLSFRTAKNGEKQILIIGGMDHKVGAKINLKNAYDNLENIAKGMYPDAKVLYKWMTQDTITLDKIPYIGEFSKIMKNIYVATGYKKWGMTTSNIAANIITDKILGKNNKYADIFTSTRLRPIKNRAELGEMVKTTSNSLIVERLKSPNPVCSHLGCKLSWNNLEKTWDCPCHGSRFDEKGGQIYGPAIKDIKIK